MKSDELSFEQCEILDAEIGKHLQYFKRLSRRMEELRFESDDIVFREVRKTINDLKQLKSVVRISAYGKTKKQNVAFGACFEGLE